MIVILDPTTAANVAAAVSQEAQRAALFAPFGSADVTVRAMNGATLRETMTYGAWVFDSATPRGATLGALIARTVSSTGAPTHFVFRAGSTDVFSMTGAVSPATADIVLAAGISVASRTNISDATVSKAEITASTALPVTSAAATAFTLSLGASAGFNGSPVTVTVTPNGPIPTGGASVTLAASNGGVLGSASLSFTSGSAAPQTTTLTRATTGSSTVTMTNNIGLTNGADVSFASSATPALVITGPSSGLERTLSGLFTVTHTGTLTGPVTVTLSDGDAYATGMGNAKFWPLNYSGSLTSTTQLTLTLSPSNPSASFWYSPRTPGAKSITLTNDGGMTNPAAHAYTAAAYTPPSATPFRLVRGGTTIGSYATLQAVKDTGGWQTGDVVKVTGGTYVVYDIADPGCTLLTTNPGGIQTGVLVDTTTIEWETPGVPMVLDYSRHCSVSLWGGGQPQLVTMGATSRALTVRGLHFRGARPPIGTSWIGAGVWTTCSTDGGTHTARTLNIEYCKFWQHADGIHPQQVHYGLSTYVRYCVFEDNSDNQGLRHDIYSGNNALLHVEGCTFRKTPGQGYPQLNMGHAIKSRCRATTVVGNMIDAEMFGDNTGGCAQNINTPSGGVVVITGNVINHYGSTHVDGDGNCLRYGDDQNHLEHPNTPGAVNPDFNHDPALTTHSLLLAQNTLRKYIGRANDGSGKGLVSIYVIGGAGYRTSGNLWSGGSLFAGSPVTTDATALPITVTIQNNIVAADTSTADAFIAAYPNNSQVATAALANNGLYSGSPIAGSPATNNANKEWAGDFTIPTVRADTNRGGRTPYIPAWVPTTPWQWADIPGTNWSAQVINDGSGSSGAPAIGNSMLGIYEAQWDYGGTCYSRKNHEIWMFGGGHAGTTINMVSRYNLHQNVPSVTMVSAPSTLTVRQEIFTNPTYASSGYGYLSDGKPKSPHAYWNNVYRDATDEFLSVGLKFIATSSDGVSIGGGASGSYAIPSCNRSGTWAAPGRYADLALIQDSADNAGGPRVLSADGSELYYWPNDQQMRKFTFAAGANGTHSIVGGPSSGRPGIVACRASDDLRSFHIAPYTGSGWGAETRAFSNGAQQVVAVTGYTPAAGYAAYGLEWVPSINKYVACFVDSGAYNGGGADPALTSVLLVELTMTDSANAVASLRTIATGSGAPTKCSSLRGMSYDPAYDCLLFAFSRSTLIKAVKVA